MTVSNDQNCHRPDVTLEEDIGKKHIDVTGGSRRFWIAALCRYPPPKSHVRVSLLSYHMLPLLVLVLWQGLCGGPGRSVACLSASMKQSDHAERALYR